MVVVMVLIASIFFYLSDSIIKVIVGFLTGIWGDGASTNG
jgi:hypothetical protein